MKIFRHLNDNGLYTIQRVLIGSTISNGDQGCRATPYNRPGTPLVLWSKSESECSQWISDNFVVVGER